MRQITMLAMVLLIALPASGSRDRGKIVQFSMGGDIRLDSAPEGASVRTMGGDIVIRRAGGRVLAKTMGGDIEIRQVDGSLEAGTMGGSVDVEVTGSATGREIRIGTMGGNIEVTFPRDFQGEFDVKVERDPDDEPVRIDSDFPLQLRESTARHFLQKLTVISGTGRSGAGGNRVRITAVGGNVVLRKR
jgi:DUF4097 and DUF4098 domain-containing protein YvlB